MKNLPDRFFAAFVFIGLIWLVFTLDLVLPLENFALLPRQLSGIPGIALSPLLHKNLSHIVANTIPLAVLLTLLVGSQANSSKITLLVILVSGVLHWLLGRSVGVIGASGLVFGLITYLIFSGFFEKRFKTILVSILVGFSYGTTLLFSVLPNQPGVSWDGHLFGAIAGVLVAWQLKPKAV